MSDMFSPSKRSEIMASVRNKNTKPELAVRSALFQTGFRYRLHASYLPGSPDIVFPKEKLAIQVRGCFWHSHGCKGSEPPTSRTNYWIPKLERTRSRDIRNLFEIAQTAQLIQV